MSYACRKKLRYRDYGAAQLGLASARRKEGKVPIRAYECPECRGWHLTSQREKPPKPVKAQKPKKWTSADDARWDRLTRARA